MFIKTIADVERRINVNIAVPSKFAQTGRAFGRLSTGAERCTFRFAFVVQTGLVEARAAVKCCRDLATRREKDNSLITNASLGQTANRIVETEKNSRKLKARRSSNTETGDSSPPNSCNGCSQGKRDTKNLFPRLTVQRRHSANYFAPV